MEIVGTIFGWIIVGAIAFIIITLVASLVMSVFIGVAEFFYGIWRFFGGIFGTQKREDRPESSDDEFSQAIPIDRDRLAGRTVEFSYIDADGNYSQRAVYVTSADNWVFHGRCKLRNDERTFRFDSVVGDHLVDVDTGEIISTT